VLKRIAIAFILILGFQTFSYAQENRRIQLDFYHSPLYDFETAIDYKLAIDNVVDYGFTSLGDDKTNKKTIHQRSPGFRFLHQTILSAAILITNRIVHERSHIIAYEEVTGDKLALTLKSVFFSISGDPLTVNQLIKTSAAGINSSYMASNRVAEDMMLSRNGNLVDWMNFLLTRTDDFLQWTTSRLVDGHAYVVKYGYKFDSEWSFDELIPNSDFYRNLPFADNAAYTTLLRLKGYDTNLDKDLAALLGANLGTAYTWQAIYSLIAHLSEGELTQKPWMLGEDSIKVSFPLITNYRASEGYFYDAKVFFDLREVKSCQLPMVVLHLGHDLDPILSGGVNKFRVGLELIDFLTFDLLGSLKIHPYGFINLKRSKGSFEGYYVGAKIEQSIYNDIGIWVDLGYTYNDLIENDVYLHDNKWKIRFGMFAKF